MAPCRGDDPDLAATYKERRSILRNVAKRVDAQDREDLYQDAFLRVVERSSAQEIPKLDNLLRHVVRCIVIDGFRRKAARRTFLSDEAGDRAVDAAADPERHLMGAQRLQRVMAAIETMPPKRREAFLMHRVEELSYAQIAKRLDVNIKTVEKHIAMAMRQLSDTDD